jgi:hypothetical protein
MGIVVLIGTFYFAQWGRLDDWISIY